MDCDTDELLDIDDPRIPFEIREHGLRFRPPAQFVDDLGGGEYALYSADGELLDLVVLK